MTRTAATLKVELLVVKLLATGQEHEHVATVTQVPLDDVERIGRENGWPHLDQLRYAVDELERRVRQAATGPRRPSGTLQPPPPGKHCGHPACGLPQRGPGRPRTGWIKVHVAGPDKHADPWFCSWRCVSINAIRLDRGFDVLTADGAAS